MSMFSTWHHRLVDICTAVAIAIAALLSSRGNWKEIMGMSGNIYAADKSKFDHSFSGWSVWLEPEENAAIDATMEELRVSCGGEPKGVVPFTPHVTLMYNLPPFQDADPAEKLKACREKFRSRYATRRGLSLLPTEFGNIKFPRSRGGWGCSIAFLMIQPATCAVYGSDWLDGLHEICLDTFGPDERGGHLTPHLSLVYAPEDRYDYLQKYASSKREKAYTKSLGGLPVKYLSLWSTEGRIQDWYRIAKIPL